MKLLIKNKNIIEDINDERYGLPRIFDIDEGAVVTQCKDETLDSATISISNLSEEIDIEPYDVCEAYSTGTNKNFSFTMCVNSFVKTQICLSPKLYKYEITLFSLVKQLEGIILPNLKITKVKDENRSIWYYMSEYLDLYCPKIKVGTSKNNYEYVRKWGLDSGTDNKWYNLFGLSAECPEMQWNQPTLREVLNDLAMLKDCIITLNADNKITFMDLTEVYEPNELALAGINYIQESKSSEDYISDLRMNLVNVTNERKNNTNEFVTVSEWHSPSSEEVGISDKNMIFKTQYPIYNIKKLEILFPVVLSYCTPSTNYNDRIKRAVWVKQDLMDATVPFSISMENSTTLADLPLLMDLHKKLIYEYSEFQVKKNVGALNSVIGSEMDQYKDFCLYYTRGSNSISGFGMQHKNLVFDSNSVLYYLKRMLTLGLAKGSNAPITLPDIKIDNKTYSWIGYGSTIYTNSGTSLIESGTNFYATYYKIEYETLEGSSFKAGKDIIKENNNYYPRHQREVMDNQTNSYIDSYSQGFLEYQKANRLGNVQKMINARYQNNQRKNNMLKIGDSVDGSIIYKCEYQFYKQHIEVNALATKDYVLRNYFTGVKAKIRSWNVVSGNEALARTDIDKWYLEFSYNKKYDIGLYNNETLMYYQLPKYFLSTFDSNNIAPLKHCYIYTIDYLDNKYPINETVDGELQKTYYKIDLISRIVGNSLVFTFGMKDNYWAGKHIQTDVIGVLLPYASETDITSNVVYQYARAVYPGGVPTQPYKYTDNNGEFLSIYWIFTTNSYFKNLVKFGDFVNEAGTSDYTGPNVGSDAEKSLRFIEYSCELPKTIESDFKYENLLDPSLDYDYRKIELSKTMYKDSQEITNISTQFEFCKDTNDIYFTKAFIERQEAIRTVNNDHAYKILIVDKNNYDFRNPQTPSNYTDSYDVDVQSFSTNINGLSRGLEISIGQLINRYILIDNAVYLVDEDGVLLMAFNNIPEDNIELGADYTLFNVYLNLLKTRDYDIYDSQTTQNVVDKL